MHAPRGASRPGRSHSRGAAGATPDIQLQQPDRSRTATARMQFLPRCFDQFFRNAIRREQHLTDPALGRSAQRSVFALSTILARAGIVSV